MIKINNLVKEAREEIIQVKKLLRKIKCKVKCEIELKLVKVYLKIIGMRSERQMQNLNSKCNTLVQSIREKINKKQSMISIKYYRNCTIKIAEKV